MQVHARLNRDSFRVREECSLELSVTADEALGVGDTVELQFPNSWSLISGPSHTRDFQFDDPDGPHYIAATAAGAQFKLEMSERHLNYPEGMARHGRLFTAPVSEGSVPAGQEIVVRYANTYAPYVVEEETIWLRVNGQAPERAPTLVTTPIEGRTLRIIVPSAARPGEPFDVLIVSLDEFENASAEVFESEVLRLSTGEAVATDLTFTGSTRVPVTLQEQGVYRFSFRGVISNAIRIAERPEGPYWGDIHIHTKLSQDGQGTDPYKYARDTSGLDFAAAADHWESLGPEGYRTVETWAEEADEPGRFVTLLADERNPEKLTGHHNVYFRNLAAFQEHKAIGASAGKGSPESEAEYLGCLDPSEAMVIPHHTGVQWTRWLGDATNRAVHWGAWDDQGLRPVMEIYSHHGQSELYNPQHVLAYEFNRMRNPERRSNTSVPGPHYAQDYWTAGRRIGVIGSSDEHGAQGGRRHGGLAAVRAPELSRDALFDALRQRHCYATTGERILIDFDVDGIPMGQSESRRPGSLIKVTLRVWGTELLLRVDILRFRFGVDDAFQPLLSDAPRPESTDACYGIEEAFEGPCMYYARVVQEPLEWPGMAWTSPIWIDPPSPESSGEAH